MSKISDLKLLLDDLQIITVKLERRQGSKIELLLERYDKEKEIVQLFKEVSK